MSKLVKNDVLNGLNLEKLETYFFETIDSTNEFAKKTSLKKPFLIALAEQQTAGKGRHGKTWHSPQSGNIYLSIKYEALLVSPALSLVIGLLVTEALDEASKQEIKAQLKWPNDVLLENKKICGILIESEIEKNNIGCTIGIGINYSITKKESWWGDLGDLADTIPREKLINIIIKKVIAYKENGYPDWQQAWEKKCMHQNEEINILNNSQKKIKGVFRGIDNEGKMLLETSDGTQTISSGECSITGLY